jgi:hypothetical protein
VVLIEEVEKYNVITCISNESLTEISALEILSNGIDGFIVCF